MMEKKISVVAPAFNHERYVSDCLYSVANQNYPNLELVVIDDCSNDGTPKIIEEVINNESFKKRFSGGIHFVRHEINKGAFFSLNQGLEIASGEYLTMINTDDSFGDDRLFRMASECERNGSEFAFGRVKVIDQNNLPVSTGYGKAIMKYQELIPKCPLVSMALCRGNGTISTGNMLFSRNLYKRLNGFGNYKYVHDWDFALRASLITEPIFVNDAIYYYRVHTGNTIAEISNESRNPDALEKPVNGQTIGKNPLVSFFEHILKNDYENSKIPDVDVWDYFINCKKYYSDDDGVVWAWNQAKDSIENDGGKL